MGIKGMIRLVKSSVPSITGNRVKRLELARQADFILFTLKNVLFKCVDCCDGLGVNQQE